MSKIYLLLLLLSFISCGKSPDIKDFDEMQWKSDHNGCKGTRIKMEKEIEAAKEQLMGLSQNEIVGLLGTPDKNELYKRNQKFFIYQISPAPECRIISENINIYLSIRFNATGLAKEVMIYRGLE